MAMIEARPDLREDHTQGVLVAEHKIMYEKFDNMQAAGRKRITTFIRTGSLPPFDIVIVYCYYRTNPDLLQREAGGYPGGAEELPGVGLPVPASPGINTVCARQTYQVILKTTEK